MEGAVLGWDREQCVSHCHLHPHHLEKTLRKKGGSERRFIKPTAEGGMRPWGWLVAVSPAFLPLVQNAALEEVEQLCGDPHPLSLLASCGLTRT